MATSHPPQTPSAEVPCETEAPIPLQIANEEALVPSPTPLEQRAALTITPKLARLPVELEVAVPVRDFRVRDLLALEQGQVIEAQWALGEDIPLTAKDAQLAWTEFEVVESKMAVRLVRMI